MNVFKLKFHVNLYQEFGLNANILIKHIVFFEWGKKKVPTFPCHCHMSIRLSGSGRRMWHSSSVATLLSCLVLLIPGCWMHPQDGQVDILKSPLCSDVIL
jgi:hypothetical protein